MDDKLNRILDQIRDRYRHDAQPGVRGVAGQGIVIAARAEAYRDAFGIVLAEALGRPASRDEVAACLAGRSWSAFAASQTLADEPAALPPLAVDDSVLAVSA